MSKTVKNFLNSREHMKNQMLDYLCIALGLMFYTIGWTCFLLPYKIVTGALTGLSAIVFYVTGIPIYQTYLTLNVVMLIAALKILGLRFLLKTIYAIVLLSTMLTLAQSWMTGADGQMIQILGAGNTFMALIIGTMFTGSGLAIVFLSNGSTGGTDIIAACINKYKDISLGNVLICVNFCIIGSCLFFSAFGATMQERLHTVVFGLFTLLTENVMLDYVFNSRRQSVQFLIFSKNYEKIASAIGSTTHHGVTILDGYGWFTNTPTKVLFVLARKRESQYIFRLIKYVDPHAFVSQSAVIGVFGNGFDEIKGNISEKMRKEMALGEETEAAGEKDHTESPIVAEKKTDLEEKKTSSEEKHDKQENEERKDNEREDETGLCHQQRTQVARVARDFGRGLQAPLLSRHRLPRGYSRRRGYAGGKQSRQSPVRLRPLWLRLLCRRYGTGGRCLGGRAGSP